MYAPLFLKIQKKVLSWKSHFLSQRGKIILIKHVIYSIPIHLLVVLCLSKKVVNQIHKLFVDFCWGSFEDPQMHHWISWERFCKPTYEGGLGYKSLYEVIYWLHDKLAWKLVSEDSPWCVVFLKPKYFCSQKWEPSISANPHSSVWKMIQLYLKDLVHSCKWSIRGGNINLWLENWIRCGNIKFLVINPNLVIKDLISNNEWDVTNILCVGDWNLVSFILKNKIFLRHGQDQIHWPYLDTWLFNSRMLFLFSNIEAHLLDFLSGPEISLYLLKSLLLLWN